MFRWALVRNRAKEGRLAETMRVRPYTGQPRRTVRKEGRCLKHDNRSVWW